MPKKKQPVKPSEIPKPGKHPEIKQPADPEDPIFPEENPDIIDIIPDEEIDEMPPYETPVPGEGP